MPRPVRSLKSEYELYVDQEIENYKDSIPRSAMLRIGDEAVNSMAGGEQLMIGEMMLCTEVDRIIRKRLRLPSYATWRRRRLKLIEAWKRPEHWGMADNAPLVQALPADTEEPHILVLGPQDESTALYLVANGCQVTAVEEDPDGVERVMVAAGQAGLSSRVNGMVAPVDAWFPAAPVHAVVSSPAAFEHLSIDERARIIEILKSATLDGGVHLVRTLAAGESVLNHDELRLRYTGWDVNIVDQHTFFARKAVA